MRLLWKLLVMGGFAQVGPAISALSTATQTEGTSLVHTVTLASAVSGTPGLYQFSISNITASTPSDYTALPTFSNGVTLSLGVLSVPIGVSTFTVTVATSQDTIYEGTETYSVRVGNMSATGTILDDETAPTITSVSSVSGVEGTTLVHAVVVAGVAQAAQSYVITLAGVTATAGSDYTASLTNASFTNGVTISGGNISVPAGVTGFNVSVATVDDVLAESSETYTLTIGGASGTGTIIDNDTVTPSYYLNLSNVVNSTLGSSQGRGTITTAMASYFLGLSSPVNATVGTAQARGTITAPVGSGGVNLWSDVTYWGGALPTALDNVIIPSATSLVLDVANAVCLSLDVQGTLTAKVDRSTGITTGNINVGGNGNYLVGTEAAPLPPQFTHTVTLNGAEVGRAARVVSGTTLGFTNNGVGRSFQVQPGGKLQLIGTSPAIKRTKLNANAAGGTNTFTTVDSTGWLAGDEIVLGTTDFYGVSTPEKLSLANNASGNTIQSTATITSPRWGVLQYVTDAGMSLTPGTLTGGAPAGIGTATATPTVVDERAFVINLRRNIIIQGANDTAWISNKFGAHCMFMGKNSSIKLDGVRFNRAGQAGALGRYPIHWHMMSYNMPNGFTAVSDGTFLGATVGHYAKNCAFDGSGQRMMTIHGTHGVTLDSNVGYDITGHAIFLEDGAEQDNVITNNVVMMVRAPTPANKLLNHDVAAVYEGQGVNVTTGTSGIWYTNPKNTLTGNWVNDAAGGGVWNSYSPQCFGLSINVALNPQRTPIAIWSDQTAMGCGGAGVQTLNEVLNDKGDTYQQGYEASFLNAPLNGVKAFKNNGGGYANRIAEGAYQNFVCADNAGMDVFGAGRSDKSVMTNTLSVAESLNNANSKRLSSYRSAFATYHELLNFKNCLLVGYTYIAGAQGSGIASFVGGGPLRLWDLYLAPIFSFSENTGNKQINCEAPFRTLPPFKDGQTMYNRNWQVAGVIHDKNGMFGNTGKYWTLNDPFFTYSATSPVAINSAHPDNGVVTVDRYYGFGDFRHPDDLTQNWLPLNVSRQDTSGTEVGNWNVPDGATAVQLGNMRSFCAHKGGRYQVSFPGHTPGNYFEMRVYLQKFLGDKCLIGVPFGGSFTPVVYQGALGVGRLGDYRANLNPSSNAAAVAAGYARYLTATGSFANVVADTTGTIFWHDTTNSVLWMQVAIEPLVTAAVNGGLYGDQVFAKEYGQTIIAISV